MIPEVIKMVSGTLALKNGYYYAVLSYRDAAGKRHQKWVSTGLPQKGNKCRAEQELIRIRSEFEIPPAAGELNSNMLLQIIWISGLRLSERESSPQHSLVSRDGQKHDSPIFPQKGANLERTGGSAHPTVLYGEAENRYAEFRYPLSCGNLSGLEVCDENRHGTAECCHEGG